LQGRDARGYIMAKEGSDPTFAAIQRKAAAQLHARGLRPTDIAVFAVMDVPRIPQEPLGLVGRILELFEPKLIAEEIDGYEVLGQSWDDGNNGTWEGNLYSREIGSGYWISANEQRQLPPEPYEINWNDVVGHNMNPRVDCRKRGSVCGFCASADVWSCTARAAVADRWPYCAGGALACVASGPAWLQCAGLYCWGQMFGGYLWQTKQHFNSCWVDEYERAACVGGEE
jgi:hypothetical protein